MNFIYWFAGHFTVVEGISLTISVAALILSTIALIYSGRSARAAEKSADATVLAARAADRQAESAERSEKHAAASSRIDVLRARAKYRSYADDIIAKLKRIQHILATSKGDQQFTAAFLTTEELTGLSVFAAEADVALDIELLRERLKKGGQPFWERTVFLYADRAEDNAKLNAILTAIESSISNAQ